MQNETSLDVFTDLMHFNIRGRLILHRIPEGHRLPSAPRTNMPLRIFGCTGCTVHTPYTGFVSLQETHFSSDISHSHGE